MPGRLGPTRPALLRVSVWLDERDGWRARARWCRDQSREFDSPLELARFLARFVDLRRAPRPGGLR